MKNKLSLLTGLAVLTLIVHSCRKDHGSSASLPYSIPSTYNFSPANYSGQTYRLSMLTELANYLKTANTQGTVVNASTMKNMFSNSGSPFSDSVLNNCGKQLENKCYPLDVNTFKAWMDSLATASNSTVAGSNGTAGVVVSTSNPSKKYLFDANGIEYAQLIEKGLMGAVFYYQAMETYLCENGVGNSVDNTITDPNDGTAMEHHWDEGFGYFGVPVDFPTNTTGIRFWGKYCNTVDPSLGTNEKIMDAFLAGRAAISNKNYAQRDVQMDVIRENWDLVCAATVIHYINEALANLTDDAIRNHSLSECLAFINCLKYNSDRKISDSSIAMLQNYLGTNFYTVTVSNLNNAKNLVSTIYNLDNVKDNL